MEHEINLLMHIAWDHQAIDGNQHPEQIVVHVPRIPDDTAAPADDRDELHPADHARDPEASLEAAQLAQVNSAPNQQDLSRADSEDSTVAYEGSPREHSPTQDNLHLDSVSEQSTLELPARPHLQVALGPHAPAQDLTAALEALAVGPPLPPRGARQQQGHQQEAQRHSSRQRGKVQPDYKSFHESGNKGGL